jgi:hypothetical protein
MPDPEKKPPSRTALVCALVFVVVGLAVAQAAGPKLFPQPAGGFSLMRIVFSGVVGGASALVGVMVGMGIDALLKKK